MLTIKMELSQSLGTLPAATQAELARVVAKAAHDVESGAKTAIQTSVASGAVYGKHRASAPGEAPANDQGTLAGSIQATPTASPLTWEVAVGAEYAEVLELGGVHMEARPFLGPAVEAVRPGFEAAAAQVINKATP